VFFEVRGEIAGVEAFAAGNSIRELPRPHEFETHL
jgi:hypothetical protein